MIVCGTRSRNSATSACGSLNWLLNTSRPTASAAAQMQFSMGTICASSLTWPQKTSTGLSDAHQGYEYLALDAADGDPIR
jgi:hypothetical protein